jgi:hypothetical protein
MVMYSPKSCIHGCHWHNGGTIPTIILPLRCLFFQALYGYAPPNREIVMQDSSPVEAVDEMLQVRTNTYHIFQKQLEATKSRMK